MRKLALAAGVAAVLASQGCTLAIPAGLFANAGLLTGGTKGTSSPAPKASISPTAQGSSQPGPGPQGSPPTAVCTVDAKATLDHFDLDKDGSWTYAEFLPWYSGIVASASGSTTLVGKVQPDATAVTAAPQQVTSGLLTGALVISNNSGLLASNNGGGLIANNGGVIANNGSGPIFDNSGAIAINVGPGGPQHAGAFLDPRSAFNKIDRDHSGKISLDELCNNPIFPAVLPPDAQPSPPPIALPSPIGDCNNEFDQVDVDHDGYVTFQEYIRYRINGFQQGGQLTPALISNAGGGPISDDMGSLTTSANAGVLIANNGGGLVSSANAGASIVNNNGGAVMANNGGQLVNAPTSGTYTSGLAVDGNLPLLLPIKSEFDQRDTNQDGQLDRSEWCGIAPPPPSADPVPTALPSLPAAICTISNADSDNDGFVSWDEFDNWTLQNAPGIGKDLAYAKFHSLDVDGDGQLSNQELCGFIGIAKPLPYPGDGSLPPLPKPTPYPLPTPIVFASPGGNNINACAQLFQQDDVNQDGFVSYDEYVNGRWKALSFFRAPTATEQQQMRDNFRVQAKEYDIDGDGQLSLTEFELACPTNAPATAQFQ